LPGEQGGPGISGYEVVERLFVRDSVGGLSTWEPCPGNKVALGGGLNLKLGSIGSGVPTFALFDGPTEDGDGWRFIIETFDDESRTYAGRIICATVAE
jgi:hypothetical protein